MGIPPASTRNPECSENRPVQFAFLRFYSQDQPVILRNDVLSIGLLIPNDDYFQLFVEKKETTWKILKHF